jgi:hypothetical protein
MVWQGCVSSPHRGPEQDWDVVALVEYPSRKAFLEMAMSEEMRKAHHHREGGLEATVLLACRPATEDWRG